MAFLLSKGDELPFLTKVGLVGVSGFAVKFGIEWITRRGVANKIKNKRKQCLSAFARIEQDLIQHQLDGNECKRIFDLPLTDLQQELHDGKIKAIDVLHVYQKQTLEVNKRLNAITEPLLDAQALASKCDSLSGEKGLLHGVPVSLKENYNLKGLDTTAGLGQFIGDVKTEDAVLVKVLKKQGAVPFIRTNIPQTMMTYECSNPVFGRSNNPYDASRGPGGSTGGEAALIGSGASILGFGSDIGGSIRAPSHFCGCYGIKTTLERLSRKGTFALSKGQMQVSGTVGPMSRDLDGLVLAMKALLCDYHFELDPQVPPIKFRDQIYESKKPLRIGFYVHDGYVQPVPACQRAVLMAKQALEGKGHTVVEFTPPRVKYVLPNLYMKSVQGDGGKSYTSKVDWDIVDPTIAPLMRPSKMPKWMLWLLSWLAQKSSKDPVLGAILRARIGIRTVYGWFQHAIKLQAYKDEFLDAWRAKTLDAVICPVFACTAIPHGKVVEVIMGGGGYCMLYNVVNYPAGSLPVTKVTDDDIINMKDYPNHTAYEKNIRKVTVGSQGLPVNVQCVAPPYQEELVLRVMKEIETGLQHVKT